MQMGGNQELLLRLRARTGDTWGALGLYREPEQPLFSSDEKEFLTAASVPLAEGVRRSLLFGEAQDPDWPDGPGLVVVSASGELESVTESARAWLDLILVATRRTSPSRCVRSRASHRPSRECGR